MEPLPPPTCPAKLLCWSATRRAALSSNSEQQQPHATTVLLLFAAYGLFQPSSKVRLLPTAFSDSMSLQQVGFAFSDPEISSNMSVYAFSDPKISSNTASELRYDSTQAAGGSGAETEGGGKSFGLLFFLRMTQLRSYFSAFSPADTLRMSESPVHNGTEPRESVAGALYRSFPVCEAPQQPKQPSPRSPPPCRRRPAALQPRHDLRMPGRPDRCPPHLALAERERKSSGREL